MKNKVKTKTFISTFSVKCTKKKYQTEKQYLLNVTPAWFALSGFTVEKSDINDSYSLKSSFTLFLFGQVI